MPRALVDKGITALVLKYRLYPTAESLDSFKASMSRPFPRPPANSDSTKNATPPGPPKMDLSNQLADAEAAYNMILKRAKEWGVDTSRVGMIGFSAGAGLRMHSTLNPKIMKLVL